MNKAQNAQIRVNSHVVFTVYCHYLHDLGQNSHKTQHRQYDCTTVRFSQAISVKPITILFICLSFVFFFIFFLTWWVGGVRRGEILLHGEKNKHNQIKHY